MAVLYAAGFAGCLLLPLSPALALAAGALATLCVGPFRTNDMRRWTRQLLQWSVIGLGAGMDLRVVAQVGLHGVGYTVVGIASTLLIGTWLGRRLRLARTPTLLVSLGTAICGGSAIAAAAPVLRADDEDTSVALATVFTLNAVALLVFPTIGHALHLSPSSFGLWAALAIHDTSSVVGASLAFGPAALATATCVKLGRALWIAPTTALLGWGAGTKRAKVPLFIVGFVLAAALGTFVLPQAAPAVSAGGRRLLVGCLFLVGTGISPKALRDNGWRPLLHGTLLWIIVAAITLTAVSRGWIS